MAQLRQIITEYCVLSNGSADIRGRLESKEQHVKSLMLYGPPGML